jgi:hypothetical protein
VQTIIVSGAVANKYLRAGEAWHRAQWVLGLRQLGFRVYFVEQIAAAGCHDAAGAPAPFRQSANLAYLQEVAGQLGWADAVTLVHEGREETYGLSFADLREVAAEAALVINISGHLTLEEILRPIRRKVYIDEDPGFTQFWHAAGNSRLGLDGHDYYFTVGENVGKPGCAIPTGGIRWRPTRPFAVLSEWPCSRHASLSRFTTVGSWRGPYGPVNHGGRTYGLKVHEFRKFIELPRRVPCAFELALDIHQADAADLQALLDHGWHVVDPREVAANPVAFRRYLQGSGAEFSVAKGIYVETNSGWFSDRTVRYLASGKPALVQDTDFGRNIPAGEGLVAFRTLEEAAAGAERILTDYPRHCRAARALAEDYFDSDKVLGRLLEEVGLPP